MPMGTVMMMSTGSTPLMPPLTTLLPLDELANRPSAMEPNRAGRESLHAENWFPWQRGRYSCKSRETCYNNTDIYISKKWV